MVVARQTRRRETPMSHYQHLTISEQESIWENKLAGKSLREIARQTGHSGIYHANLLPKISNF